jgi:hypothetical protein
MEAMALELCPTLSLDRLHDTMSTAFSESWYKYFQQVVTFCFYMKGKYVTINLKGIIRTIKCIVACGAVSRQWLGKHMQQ